MTLNRKMRICLKMALTMTTVLLLSVTARANEFITPGYLYNSDPTCHVINDTFYLFCTHDQSTDLFTKGGYVTMFDYHCYTTTNFRDWVDHGSFINRNDVGWIPAGMEALWDGDAGIAANGKYYAYLTFGDAIGVFVSDYPCGPYHDALGKPLIGRSTPNVGGTTGLIVSPSVVFDGNGQPYLYFGQNDLFVAKLKPDMISLAENPYHCTIPSDYFEGPMIVMINGKFYMSYSNGAYGNGYIKYCVSNSVYGPYASARNMMLPWPEQLSTQHGMVEYKGAWYTAYHMEYPDKSSSHRHTRVTTLTVNTDGSLGVIDPMNDPGIPNTSPKTLKLDAFAVRREAEEFHARSNATEEKGVWEDYHFKMKNGGYLRFDGIDFGAKAAGFVVQVSCENQGITKGRVEFRLDAISGTLVGYSDVYYTGGTTNYVELSGQATGASGVHKLYIVASGSGGNASGQLFNVNWFTFTRTYRAADTALFGVNCGGPAADGLLADQAYAAGGWGYEGNTDAKITTDLIYPALSMPNAMKTERHSNVDSGSYSYKFTVPDGKYRVQLCFAESFLNTIGARTFDVKINNASRLTNFDIMLAASGHDRGVMREFGGITPSGGLIDIAFTSKVQRAKVNVIKIFREPSTAAVHNDKPAGRLGNQPGALYCGPLTRETLYRMAGGKVRVAQIYSLQGKKLFSMKLGPGSGRVACVFSPERPPEPRGVYYVKFIR